MIDISNQLNNQTIWGLHIQFICSARCDTDEITTLQLQGNDTNSEKSPVMLLSQINRLVTDSVHSRNGEKQRERKNRQSKAMGEREQTISTNRKRERALRHCKLNYKRKNQGR